MNEPPIRIGAASFSFSFILFCFFLLSLFFCLRGTTQPLPALCFFFFFLSFAFFLFLCFFFVSLFCGISFFHSSHQRLLFVGFVPPPVQSTCRYRVFCFVLFFYQIELLGFTGFYWVLLSFNALYRVLLGFYWVLLDLTGFYWVLLGFIGFYWVLLDFTGFHWV